MYLTYKYCTWESFVYCFTCFLRPSLRFLQSFFFFSKDKKRIRVGIIQSQYPKFWRNEKWGTLRSLSISVTTPLENIIYIPSVYNGFHSHFSGVFSADNKSKYTVDENCLYIVTRISDGAVRISSAIIILRRALIEFVAYPIRYGFKHWRVQKLFVNGEPVNDSIRLCKSSMYKYIYIYINCIPKILFT